MTWIARQPLSRVLVLAAAWPTALVLYVLWHLAAIWFEAGGQAYVYAINVSSWSAVILVIIAPSLAILGLWAVARRLRPPAG